MAVEVAGVLEVCLEASEFKTTHWPNSAGYDKSVGTFRLTQGSPSLTTYSGSAGVYFDGNSRMTASVGTPADLCGTHDRSVEYWFHPAATGIKDVFSYGTTLSPGNRMGLGHQDGSKIYFNGHHADCNSPASSIDMSNWFHAALTYTFSTTTFKIYVNGVEEASCSLSLNTACNNDMVVAGTQMFNGHINSVRVHTGALSAAQVLANYNRGVNDANPCLDPPTPSGTIEIASTLEVCLQASTFSGSTWPNSADGATVGSFTTQAGSPSVTTYNSAPALDLTAGNVQLRATGGVPASLCGANDRTVEVWGKASAAGGVKIAVAWGQLLSTAVAAFGQVAGVNFAMWGFNRDCDALSGSFDTTDWHYLTFTYSSSVQKLYRDGVFWRMCTNTWNTNCGSGNMDVGSHVNGGDKWIGYLGVVRVHSGALTSEQIWSNYNLGVDHSTPCSSTPPSVNAAAVSGWSASDATLRVSCVTGASNCVTLLGSNDCDAVSVSVNSLPLPLLLEVALNGRDALVQAMVTAGCSKMETDVMPHIYQIGVVDNSVAALISAYV